jgi:hypothetical protein
MTDNTLSIADVNRINLGSNSYPLLCNSVDESKFTWSRYFSFVFYFASCFSLICHHQVYKVGLRVQNEKQSRTLELTL